MRTGAIFARGSCRALTWVLALAAMAVVSAGEAVAQPTKITVSKTSVEVEEGGVASFTVSLDKAALVGGTTVTVATRRNTNGDNFVYTVAGGVWLRDTANSTLKDATIQFAEDSKGPMLVSVSSPEDDNAADGEEVLGFTSPGLTSANVAIMQDDNDRVAVNLSTRSLTVPEGGTREYTIVLGSMPGAEVTIKPTVTSINSVVTVALVDSTSTATPKIALASWDGFVHFQAADDNDDTNSIVAWDAPQTIRVTANSDANTINGTATIRHPITTVDADYATATAPSVSVKEIDSVRTISVTASADSVQEGETVDITATLGHPDEEDFTGSLVLSEDVMVTLRLDRNPAASGSWSLSPSATLTIVKGTTTTIATLAAKHDPDDDDENLSFSTSVTGLTTVVLGDAQKVEVAIEDDDTYTLTANKTEVNEGDKATLTVEVEPKAALDTDVKIELYRASGATVEPGPGDVPDYVTIKEGETEAEFTLKTVKDADSTNEEIVARAKVGSAIVGDDLVINVLDGQIYTFSVEPDSIGEADGEASVMVTVNTNKVISSTMDTMLTLAVDAASTAMDPDDYSIMPAEMMVTISKGEKMGMTTLMVTPVADSMDESNETIVLTAWKDDAQVGNAATLTIVDGDSPGSGITAKSGTEVEMVFTEAGADGLMVGGESVSVDMGMLFDVANADLEVMYIVSSSDETVLEVSATDSTLMLDPMMEGMSTVSVMAQPAGMASARGAVSAFTCVGACVSVNLDVAGAVTFMLTPAAVSVTEGGEGMTITATASQAVLANTEVMLMHGAGSASADDYGLVPVMITIMAGDTEGSTMLTATEDTDVEGMEAVTLNAMIGTMSVGMVEVTIEDNDMPTTYTLAPATGMVDEGGEAVITATASQAVMEDTMVSLTATGGTASADDYSVDAITIMTGETSGSTMLIANDDYDVEGMETLTLQGSIGAMIIGSVMFEIADNDMEITVELSSEDMNIVEGDMDAANGTKAAAMLTATASSAVQVDTTVVIMRDGTSSAGMDDFTADPITITAGETVGTTMVMAVEDNMPDSGAGMPEMLVLYGSVDGMNTNMVSFYIWDMAVPALPLIAQLLLAAFLAIGGYRRYLRR